MARETEAARQLAALAAREAALEAAQHALECTAASQKEDARQVRNGVHYAKLDNDLRTR